MQTVQPPKDSSIKAQVHRRTPAVLGCGALAFGGNELIWGGYFTTWQVALGVVLASFIILYVDYFLYRRVKRAGAEPATSLVLSAGKKKP